MSDEPRQKTAEERLTTNWYADCGHAVCSATVVSANGRQLCPYCAADRITELAGLLGGMRETHDSVVVVAEKRIAALESALADARAEAEAMRKQADVKAEQARDFGQDNKALRDENNTLAASRERLRTFAITYRTECYVPGRVYTLPVIGSGAFKALTDADLLPWKGEGDE